MALGLAGAVSAQDEVITAQVDRTALTTDEVVTLTLVVNRAGGASEPQLPPLDGFNVLGQSSGTQISIINGDMQVQATYSYYLQPTRPGDLTIGPVTVRAGGQTYQSAPITVTVTQGTGQSQPVMPTIPGVPSLPGIPSFGNPQLAPSASGGQIPAPPGLNGQDYFVEATVDKTNPYQGEQVLYTFRFYQGASLFNEPAYEQPDFTGFWHERQEDQAAYTTEAGGRTYYVNEITTVLFPTVSGPATIGPATLEIPGGFLDPGRTLTTQPIILDIKPLPDNPPASFSGAVGRFDLQASVDKAAVEVNDAVTLQATLSGEGNIQTLPDLAWQLGPEWRAFDATSSQTVEFINGVMQGSRTYKQVLVPTQPGDLAVPAITYTYFDPTLGEYQTIGSQPILVRVSPDSSPAQLGQPTPGTTLTAANGATLRPMKAAPARWSASAAPLVERPAYWLLAAAPLVMLGGVAAWEIGRRRLAATDGDRQRRRSAKEALAALEQARRAPETAAAVAGPTLEAYLGQRFSRPVGGMTHKALGLWLTEQGLDDATAGRVVAVRRECEAAGYAPLGADLTPLLDEVAAVIQALEDFGS